MVGSRKYRLCAHTIPHGLANMLFPLSARVEKVRCQAMLQWSTIAIKVALSINSKGHMLPMKSHEYFALLTCYSLRNKIYVTHLPDLDLCWNPHFSILRPLQIFYSPKKSGVRNSWNSMDDNRNVNIWETIC